MDKLFWSVDDKPKQLAQALRGDLDIAALRAEVKEAKSEYVQSMIERKNIESFSTNEREYIAAERACVSKLCALSMATQVLLSHLDALYTKKEAAYHESSTVPDFIEQVVVLREKMSVLRELKHYFKEKIILADLSDSKNFSFKLHYTRILEKRDLYLGEVDVVLEHSKLDEEVRVPHRRPLGFLDRPFPIKHTHSIDCGPIRTQSLAAPDKDDVQPTVHASL